MALQTFPAVDRRTRLMRASAHGLLLGVAALGLAACSQSNERPEADLAGATRTAAGRYVTRVRGS